ncbi:MAG TPA: CHRD domain-containing protein [Candidatus Limnocylindria bacterium]|nr:CHRD domain-containing protein [Candidatus Limnocylindria bacterium]
MRTRVPSLLLPAVLAAIASLALATAALAAPMSFSADLTNGGEGDEDGSGTATITIDPDTGEVCWDLTVEGIEPVTASHIHVGAEGASGDVVVPLDVDGFEGSSSDCVDASDADLDAIIADPAGYYVNIHTEDFPAGAIRGQLVAGPPDTAMETPTSSPWAALGLLLVGMAGVLGVRAARRRA